MSDADDLVLALRPVAETLKAIGFRFYVGGSVASSYHGAVRSTMDVDLVGELTEADVPSLLKKLGSEYYASEPAIRDAIRRQSCFNLVHLPMSFKVDVFVSQQRPFDLQVIARAQLGNLDSDTDWLVPIATAEDIIVIKLQWYRLDGETSERQWNDMSRLILLLGASADFDYLHPASQLVGVENLLVRLLEK
ncbi:hypothetical protein [Roseimaritima ulvae]|uniref:Uncharacterized protein n=1 Tax=Roseimaritima ulvae TaxID=980254 RepID=A0A5B9R374_9BACT|nr:hypothetical protein [Roseimaritima ulvae]QEG40773.1 hypothetical protein UC8_27910 [Roseimaritima ulvae]